MHFYLVLLLSLVASGQTERNRGTTGFSTSSVDAQAPYSGWQHGPPADPGFFPIAVWLQDPRNAERYKRAGINLYVGLWAGPTDAQLASLKAAGMSVICEQNRVGLAHRDDPTIVGWMHGDEPDNAQEIRDEKTGRRRYGPPVAPAKIVANYEHLRAADPTRPVMLNLGQGVANDEWIGRGPGASLDDYPAYVRGSDIVSFDVYPVADLDEPNGAEFLWYVPKGIDRLVKWTGGRKLVWNCIECTRIHNPAAKATPAQVKSEVWMALIHGSRGLIYFVHQFKPQFNEHALFGRSGNARGRHRRQPSDQRTGPAIEQPNGRRRRDSPLVRSRGAHRSHGQAATGCHVPLRRGHAQPARAGVICGPRPTPVGDRPSPRRGPDSRDQRRTL